MPKLVFPNEPIFFTFSHLDRLLVFCHDNGASDITIQSGERVLIEVNGVLEPITSRALSQQEVSDLINHIYGPNATASLFSGKDLDTNYRVRVSDEKAYRYRVNITACLFDGYEGIQVTLRTLSSAPPPLDKMALPEILLDAMKLPQGILVISGSTGSGKSTLLSSMIGELVQKEGGKGMKILTYESPVEYVYDEIPKPNSVVSQTEIPRFLPSFAAGVRNALRRKPSLILVGEARDQETIEAVIDAALTGHPVYTTVHSNGVADTLRRMVTAFEHAERDARMYDLLESVKVIIWQALVRTPDGQRTPLREYLIINDHVRDHLLKCPVEELVTGIRELLPKYGKRIEDDATEKYEAGLICEEAYKRFTEMKGVH